MSYDPQKHNRRSMRLKGYDYAQAGAYFVTICTHRRIRFFQNKSLYRIAAQCWQTIPAHIPSVEMVRTYKAAVTTLCRRAGYQACGWQRNYHERIIRTEADLSRIRQYIIDNPLNW